jgi:uncharacterized lipoprotein YddW (UPF0748 family)
VAGLLATFLVGTSLVLGSSTTPAAATTSPDVAPRSADSEAGDGATARAVLDDDRPLVRTEDGATHRIDGANTARGAGVLLEYTPDWAFSTGTNIWGAEAALVRTSDPTRFRIVAVNSIRIDPSRSGDTEIPPDGLVLSAGPDGDTDPVGFITDHFRVGEYVTIARPTSVTSTEQAHAIDPTAESNPEGAPYPGYRGTDQLIVYTPAYGSSTGTNQWGYEVVVRDGVVTALSGANSAIPADGYVLSGHGVMADWLRRTAIVGASVTLSGHQVTIRRDVLTSIRNAEAAIAESEALIRHAHDAYLNVPLTHARDRLDVARTWVRRAEDARGVDDQAALFYVDKAIAAAREAYYLAMPARPADARGMWYRPVETSVEEIRRTLDRMRAAGMNELYLETYFRGYTIYPSAVAEAHGLPAQNPAFEGFDPLPVWKQEAAKRGIALHAWIDGLAVGNELGEGIGPVLSTHPEWAAVDRDHADDPRPHTSTNGFYWLDVSDPVAREYFLDLMVETVATYDLDGLNIDYMRYPIVEDWRKTFNFSPDARRAFENAHGVDPVTLEPSDERWEVWQRFVEDEENRLVAELSARIKRAKPSAVVSAAPEGGTEAAKVDQWSDVVDVVIPQAYTPNLEAIRDSVAEMADRMRGGQLVYTGVAPLYQRLPVFDSVRQAVGAKELDAGTVIFSFGQAGVRVSEALSSGPWRGTAVPPGLRPVAAVKAVLTQARADLDEIYLPRDGIDSGVAKALHGRVRSIVDDLSTTASTGHLRALTTKLLRLTEWTERQRDRGAIAEPVATNLTRQLTEARRILDYAIARDMR